jgi:hypothetical protein
VTLDELDDLVRLRLRDAAAALLPTWFWVVIEIQGEQGEELGAEDAGALPILEQSVAPAGALRRAAGKLGVRPGRMQYTSMYAKTPLPGPAVESCLVQGLRHHGAHVSDPWLRTLDP